MYRIHRATADDDATLCSIVRRSDDWYKMSRFNHPVSRLKTPPHSPVDLLIVHSV